MDSKTNYPPNRKMPDQQPLLPGMEPEEEKTTPRPTEVVRPPVAERSETPHINTRATPVPDDLTGRKVYVVDSHSLIHQVFHALPEMSDPLGRPVSAVFGFARDVMEIVEKDRPDYLFCAFDLRGKTFRHELYEPYKAKRTETSPDLIPQFPEIHRFLATVGIQAVGCEGYEADDILATIARLVDQRGGECRLITTDKDCRQLITDRVHLYNMRKKAKYDAASLEEDWGVRPEQVVDFQALVGDSVDNVPGVPLIGPKIAQELIQKWGTLEAVLDHAEDISGKKRKQNLMEGREMALMSRRLVQLDVETPVMLDWDAARVEHVNFQAARPLFMEYGFRNLLKKLDENPLAAGLTPAFSSTAPSVGASPAVKETAIACVPIDIAQVARLVDTPEKFQEFLAELKDQKSFSLDTETTHLWPRWAKLVGMSFCWSDTAAYYLPVQSPEEQDHLDKKEVLEALRPVLENPNIEKIGQNLKYDLLVLRGEGVQLRGIGFDTMIADYLCEAGNRRHSLDELALRYLNHETIKIKDLVEKKSELRMEEVDTAKICDYAAEDALIPWLLRPLLDKTLQQENLEKLFHEVELPLVETLADLEWNGICVDRDRLKTLSVRYQKRIEELEEEIYALAGRPFNIASPKQLQVILFEELDLPVVKRTKTGPSTDMDVLTELSDQHPLPKKIVEYRHYAKLKSTYVDALPEMIHPVTGRIHTSFNQVVTATGRLSSSDPNLQNIPVRDKESREIRSAFIPSDGGKVLLAADYSQIELRVLAHYSGDESLCAAFENGEDIHARVASQVNGVPLDQVTSEMRRQAKTVNFGIIYGQSAFGLSKELGISREDASAFISAYFSQFTKVDIFFQQVLDGCRQKGYVETILGRRRYIAGVRENPPRQTNLAERMAVNTVIQGSAADLIKLAMNSVRKELENRQFPAEILLQIHDELVFEVSTKHQDALAQMVVDKMSQAYPLRVPLVVSVKAGNNWGDLEMV